MSDFCYVGSELTLFDRAERWKQYWASHIRHYLIGDVLEVGAGIGANTRRLLGQPVRRWVCLEPDPRLAERLEETVRRNGLAGQCEVLVGQLKDLTAAAMFDAILYIDVLEHIAKDADELAGAAARLRPGGRLVVLAPAHPFLFTPFDAAVGHYRRYSKGSLAACGPSALALERVVYLDSCGLLASLGNRLLLRQRMPTPRQVAAWDRLLVPASRWLDPITGYRLGKSVLAVWRQPAQADDRCPDGLPCQGRTPEPP